MTSNASDGMLRITRRQLLRLGLAGTSVTGLVILANCGTSAPVATTAPTPASSQATTVPTPVSSQATSAATKAPIAQATAQPTPPSPVAAAGSPKRGGNLIAAGTGEIKFDPYFNFVPARFVYGQFFGALVDYRGADPYKPNPQLAESWEETDKMLTLKLRKGVRFHNGREFTSQDVVDNINRAKDKSIGHYLFAAFDPSVDGAEVIDQYTVRINYKKVYPVKLDDLAGMYIIPKEAMPEIGAKPVGSGPYKFGSYTPGDKLEMTRFEDYWDKEKVYLDKVTVKILADPQARLANLLGGSVDVVDALALSDAGRLKSENKVQVVSIPPGGTWYSNVFNCAKPPFDNKLIRQALNYTVDRDKINKLAYYSLAPVTQSRYLPSSPWYDEKANTMYKFDLQKAKTLLQQGGQPDGFKTSIAVSETVLPGSKAMAQVWAQDLDKVGVKMEIVEREQGPFYDEYFKGNYDIQAYGLGDGKFDPATFLTGNSPYRLTDNKANIQNLPFFAEYKKLIEDGANSIDPKVRKPIYDRVQEIMAEEGWVVITAFWVNFMGLSKRVQGYRATIDPPQFESVWLEG